MCLVHLLVSVYVPYELVIKSVTLKTRELGRPLKLGSLSNDRDWLVFRPENITKI